MKKTQQTTAIVSNEVKTKEVVDAIERMRLKNKNPIAFFPKKYTIPKWLKTCLLEADVDVKRSKWVDKGNMYLIDKDFNSFWSKEMLNLNYLRELIEE